MLSKKIVDIGSTTKGGVCGISPLRKHRSTIADATGIYGEVEYKIFYGNQNTSCSARKPIIIVDGFDPDDSRRISFADCQNDARCVDANPNLTEGNYLSIERLMRYNNGTTNQPSLIEDLNQENFDVILVNFPYYNKIENNPNSEQICAGADDIFRNGKTFASFIQKINTDLQSVGSTEKLVVVGPSMGGLITRYALSYLEKQGINHNTKLWVSMDSPHKGANIPLAVQQDIWFFGKKLKQLKANLQFDNTLHSKAAEQMLIDIIDFNGSPTKNVKNDAFQSEMNANGVSGSSGFPVSFGIKNIAIANGSLAGILNVQPKENFLHIAASAKIRLFGIRVGRKRIFNLNNFYMPNFGSSTVLTQLQGRNPDENVGDTSYSTTINSWWNANGSMDAVPGGSTNSSNDLKDIVNGSLNNQNAFTFPIPGIYWLTTDSNLIIDNIVPTNQTSILSPQSFIPTHSSLSTTGFSNWYQPINKNIVCSGQTPFNSFFGEGVNMEHVTFSNNMVTWLKNNIVNGLQSPWFPIEDSALSGADIICENSTSTYSFSDICKLPSGANWTLNNNFAQIVSSTASSVTLKGLLNGGITLTATFQNGQTLTKKIWIGKPKVYVSQDLVDYVHATLKSEDPNVTLAEQGVNPTDVIWRRLSNNLTQIGYKYFFPTFTNPIPVEVKATNLCGTTTLQYTIEYESPCGEYKIAKYTGEATYKFVDPCPPEQNRISNDGGSENKIIEISDIYGRVVLRTNKDIFDISKQPIGTYYVRVIKNGKIIHTQTLLKN